jgi:hypothetical protein
MTRQNIAHKPTKIAIVGGSGTGKSTYFCKFLANSRYTRKFIFDHQGEMSQRLGVQSCIDAQELDAALTAENPPPYIIFDPSLMFEGDLPGAFDFFCDFVFLYSKQDPFELKLFAIDELQDIVSTDVCNVYLAKVLETGRRYGLDWISVQQGLNCVHNRIRNQMTEVVIFRTTDQAPLKALPLGIDVESVVGQSDGQYTLFLKRTGQIRTGKIF